MMPTLPKRKFEAWSFSRWSAYERCPRAAKLELLDRVPVPKGAALERGAAIHDLAKRYVVDGLPRLPAELKLFAEEFRALRKTPGVVAEAEWAFDKAWKTVGWFDPDVWVRIKVDVAHPLDDVTLKVIDHKTGKLRAFEEYRPQLELYAVGALCTFPGVRRVVTELWFLDEGKIVGGEACDGAFERRDLPKLKRAWLDRSRAMLRDRAFVPRPGAYCRWCVHRREAGGPCEF